MTPCSCTSGCTAARSCLCKRQHRQCTSECHPSHTCSLQCSLGSPMSSKVSTTINADSVRIKSPKSPKARTWISLGGNDLLMEDKWLIESGKWINDRIISAWQFLLQQKYPSVGGLHSTVVVSKRKFKRDSRKHEVVQVLNSGNNHWVAISTLGCSIGVVHWLDSMHCGPSSQLKVIVSDLLQCPKDRIQIKMLNVQLQSGGSDCGLFALANITAALDGVDPSSLHFIQNLMRTHLVTCLEQKDPRPFPLDPSKRQARSPKILDTQTLRIYCVCRLPDNGNLMVMCIKCHKWFHKSCTDVRDKSASDLKKIDWNCISCSWSHCYVLCVMCSLCGSTYRLLTSTLYSKSLVYIYICLKITA